ncbi:hypothetical protein HF989_09645 [Corynebacterium mucifaciens]|uniref:Uncharacterized protein n=1 Tax=Corynebacterium mucifaciens TaxID=57171 RepID=A0A7X6RFR4_9CORY|nr:hypothetical protein [Corynebacterium mucifaciens]
MIKLLPLGMTLWTISSTAGTLRIEYAVTTTRLIISARASKVLRRRTTIAPIAALNKTLDTRALITRIISPGRLSIEHDPGTHRSGATSLEHAPQILPPLIH